MTPTDKQKWISGLIPLVAGKFFKETYVFTETPLFLKDGITNTNNYFSMLNSYDLLFKRYVTF